jgi:hypothetical protein
MDNKEDIRGYNVKWITLYIIISGHVDKRFVDNIILFLLE